VLGGQDLLPADAASSPAASVPKPFSGRVLVVEDNLINQEVAVNLLAELGLETDVAGNGIEAIELVERTPYAVVLMDCQMPEMDGYEATAEIRKREKGRKRTPIVAMTAHALAGDRERCLAAGMDDYISKPIRLEALQRVFRTWMAAPAAQPEAAEEPKAPEEPALRVDMDRLRRVSRDDDGVRRMVGIFLEESRGRFVELQEAVAAKDAGRAGRAAHTLGGASGNLGFLSLAAGMRELEERCRRGDLTGADERVARLVSELERLKEFLKGQIQEGAGGQS
jgi:CheY-like chemotaxis protein/HPt (histidine-containing phosphotransfer) domain-containing protein